MATGKGYLEYVLEQLSDLEDITYRMMMGEYIIYYRGKVAAYLCDNRFLIKPVKRAVELMPCVKMEKPYEGAKEMLLLENVEDKDFLTSLFEEIYGELPVLKKKC